MSTHAEDLEPLDEPEELPPPPRPRPRPRRRILRRAIRAIVVMALLVGAAAYTFWPQVSTYWPEVELWSEAVSRFWPEGSPARAGYVTVAVDRGPIEQVVNATGTVNPVTTVQVGTYVSGPIQAIDVGFNARVKKGQRVAKIDPAPFAVKVREAEANVQNTQAKVGGDRADVKLKKLLLERNRALLARNLIARNDVDTAETAYEVASAQLALDQAAVALAQGSLDEAKVNLRYTDIVSPVDGVVVSVNVAVGQTVAASFQTPTLFLIAGDLTKMQVDTNVSESDVGRVREGQPTTFTVDAYPGQPFHGKVAQVRNAPITVQNVVTYDVVIAVENAGLELKPGMTANVSVTTAKRDQALRIPVRALRFRPDGRGGGTPDGTAKENAVYVLAPDGALHRVKVEAGIRDNQRAELLQGHLHEGDPIVVGLQREGTDAPAPPKLKGFKGLKHL